MKYRVAQWATGNLGRAAVEAVVSHPQLDLVAVWVHSDSKAGRDAGDVCGLDSTGVVTTQSLDDVLAADPDCVLYSPIMPNEAEIVSLLTAGVDVVTPLGWFYPKRLNTKAIDAACAAGKSTLHGTGIHPGGMTERIPLVLSSFSRAVTYVRSEEYSDCRSYGAVDVLRDIMLFGKSEAEASASPMLHFLGSGFGQSIHMIADTLGFELDDSIQALHDIATANETIDSPIGPIEPGGMCAQRFTWNGTVGGEPVVTARVNWFMGYEGWEAPWKPEPGSERYELEIVGDPSTTTVIHGIHPDASMSLEEVRRRNPGMVATAVHCVSAIPYVCEAPAGIRTYLDLPLVAGRAAP